MEGRRGLPASSGQFTDEAVRAMRALAAYPGEPITWAITRSRG